jgi:hypothetical protein
VWSLRARYPRVDVLTTGLGGGASCPGGTWLDGRVLIIDGGPMAQKYMVDVFRPRWSPFSVDSHATMTMSARGWSG